MVIKIGNKQLLTLFNIVVFFIIIILFLSGCYPRTQIVLLPDSKTKVGVIEISNTGGTQILNKAWQSTENASMDIKQGKPKIMTKEEVHRIFSADLAAEPAPPVNFITYYRINSAVFSIQSLPQMVRVFDAIKARKNSRYYRQ